MCSVKKKKHHGISERAKSCRLVQGGYGPGGKKETSVRLQWGKGKKTGGASQAIDESTKGGGR